MTTANSANLFYRTLCKPQHQLLLTKLEVAARYFPLGEAERRFFPKLFAHYRVSPPHELDVPRLYALLKKDLRGADLQGEDFSRMQLSGFDFTRANLRGANLSGANLARADLTGADLTGASCVYAKLPHARLRRATLDDADCSTADLSHADCTEATFNRATCARSTFFKATCVRVRAEHAHFEGSDWEQANWESAVLDGAFLYDLKGCKANLRMASMGGATVRGANFGEANLGHAVCRNSDWYGASLKGANGAHADFAYCHLANVDFSDTNLWGTIFDGAHLGKQLQYSSKTQIHHDCHPLIGMVLLSSARSLRQVQFGLYILYSTNVCWSGFIRLLLREPAEMLKWAKASLSAVESLRPTVESYEQAYELASSPARLDLRDISSSLHATVSLAIERHQELKGNELYWLLYGVLEQACQQSDTTINEDEYTLALGRLRAYARQ